MSVAMMTNPIRFIQYDATKTKSNNTRHFPLKDIFFAARDLASARLLVVVLRMSNSSYASHGSVLAQRVELSRPVSVRIDE